MRRFLKKLMPSPAPAGGYVVVYHHFEDRTASPDPRDWIGNLSQSKMTTQLSAFRKQLDFFEKNFTLVAYEELVNRLQAGLGQTDKLLAITFDDGLHSALKYAIPELSARKIPAIVFLNGNPVLRDLTIGRVATSMILDSELKDIFLDEFSRTTGKKFGTAESAFQFFKDNFEPSFDSFAVNFFQKSRVFTERGNYPFANLSEIKSCLEANPLVTVGSHTWSHPVLSRLGEEKQKEEILGCHNALEAALDRKLPHFAYPFGGKSHFNAASEKIIHTHLGLSSCSAYGGINKFFSRSGILRIPVLNETDSQLLKLFQSQKIG